MTKFISVIDERVRCAAIIEGGTANRWPDNIAPWQPLGPSDMEQNLFPSAIYGVDNVDLHVAIAPRPLLAAIEHYAPAFDKAAQAIQAFATDNSTCRKNSLLSPRTIRMPGLPKLRLATADWFCRWFYDRKGPASEPIRD